MRKWKGLLGNGMLTAYAVFGFISLGLAIATVSPDVVAKDEFLKFAWMPELVRTFWNYTTGNTAAIVWLCLTQAFLGQISRMCKTGDAFSTEEIIGAIFAVVATVINAWINGLQGFRIDGAWKGPYALLPGVLAVFFFLGYIFHSVINFIDKKMGKKK